MLRCSSSPSCSALEATGSRPTSSLISLKSPMKVSASKNRAGTSYSSSMSGVICS